MLLAQRLKAILEPHAVKNFYEKYENHISSFALILGFILDSLSLGRVDALADRVVLTIYISLSGLCIILLSVYEAELIKEKIKGRMHFWLSFFMQFALGGLFSAFVVFYTRSSTLESSWPFLLLLLIYFLGNEIFKKYYKRLDFRLSVYFFALLSYFIIIVPILFNSIERWVFVISSFVALLVFIMFSYVVGILSPKNFSWYKRKITLNSILILIIINIFYFGNLIPPLPIILKDSGVYHGLISRTGGGYIVKSEEENKFLNFFSSKKIFHRFRGEPVYVLTSVYSPVDLNTTVVHNWQRYDDKTGEWVTQTNINVPITGGRQDGYRLYSLKQSILPGLWRVNVKTSDNRLIGRVKFEVQNSEIAHETKTLYK